MPRGKMVENTEKLERVFRVCQRVEELDTTAHNVRKEHKGWLPTAVPQNHLHKTLEKHEVLGAVKVYMTQKV